MARVSTGRDAGCASLAGRRVSTPGSAGPPRAGRRPPSAMRPAARACSSVPRRCRSTGSSSRRRPSRTGSGSASEVRGRENLLSLDGPCLIISNHSFHLDPAAVAYAVFPRRVRFTALEETFSNPVYATFLRMLGGVPMRSPIGAHELREMADSAFMEGKSLHFFPEGVMVRRGRRLLPFKRGAFLLSELCDVPVLPVTIVWRFRDRGVLRRYRPRLDVEIGEPMHADELAAARAPRSDSPRTSSAGRPRGWPRRRRSASKRRSIATCRWADADLDGSTKRACPVRCRAGPSC